MLEAIYARYGYDLREYAPASMRRRLRRVLVKTGLRHFSELQHRLLVDKPFFVSTLDDLTVQVSEMFRDPAFYLALRQHVLPVLRTYPHLKFWHAGCAGGEEVYANSILLAEEGLLERSMLYATDLSDGAIERAREGVYSEARALRFAENHAASGAKGRFDDYCSRAYGHVAIKEAFRKNVVFFQHDLSTDYAPGEMHVVFCRNVLIYFSRRLRERVVQVFARCLSHRGFLCLGAKERLSEAELEMFESAVPGESIYRLRAPA